MLLTEYDIHDFQTEVCADNTTDKQSKTHSFRSGSPTWSSKSSMCGSDRTGFASSSRMTDSLASEGHPAFRGGGGNGNRPPVMAGGGPPSVASDQDQVDTYSVTSGGSIMYREPGLQEDQGPGDRVYLTPAQVALQTQLKSKHAELSRRIALQQAELLRWQRYDNHISKADESLKLVINITFKSNFW